MTKDLTAQERDAAVEKIYGEEGAQFDKKGEAVFEKRAAFDEANKDASIVSKVVGEENAQHDLARSAADSKADNA